MPQTQVIQWFPGHMAKARRKLKESLKLVDAVAEIIDARIPISSRNPEILSIISGKPHILMLNKIDVSDETQTEKWREYYSSLGIEVLKVDCCSGKGLNSFSPCIERVLKEKIEKWRLKGIKGRAVRVMVVGIPNVGKSSFINKISNTGRAKVEDRPGVTRSNQWFPVSKKVEILDTPGALWPKFDDNLIGENLAFTGAIKDDILDIQELAAKLIETLKSRYRKEISLRFKLESRELDSTNSYEILNFIGQKRGMLLPGGKVDLQRASVMIIDEFRAGKLGRITLETVENIR